MGKDSFFQSGNFLPDGNHVVAILNFTGAPASPDPGRIYTGLQVILVRSMELPSLTGIPGSVSLAECQWKIWLAVLRCLLIPRPYLMAREL
jgi:hypothetical protein